MDLTRVYGDQPGLHEAVEDLFAYHGWSEDQKIRGDYVRKSLAEAYKTIVRHVKPCPGRTRALNAIVDSRMLANNAISFEGRP